jgi:hypothetical protein
MNVRAPARNRLADRVTQGMSDEEESGHSGPAQWVKYHMLGVILGIPPPRLNLQFEAK